MGAVLGNHYTTVFPGAEAAALAAGGGPNGTARLEAVVADINAHHAVFAGPGSLLPPWLADAAINEMR